MKARIRLLHGVPVLIAVAVALFLLGIMYTTTVEAATAPSLGTAVSFGVLGSSTVTNTGATIVNGNLGVSPGSAVTGFPPGVVVPPGTINAANGVSAQARTDATTAYNNLAGQPCNFNLTGQNLGGLTLTPGVYCFPNTTAQLTGPLTLDAQNNANAVFVFQVGSALTTASNSSVNMINGGSACNVFWQIGSTATLGTNTAFKGNILANTSVVLNTGTSIVLGRAIALNAAVTMDTNTVTMTGCANPTTPAAPTLTAVAATQTAIAPTLTAIAPTLTAIAATQTAIAPTRTPTSTPTLVPSIADIVPPTGNLTKAGTDGLGNKYIQMTAKDIGSGIASIVIIKSTNAATVVASFIPGTTQPVLVTSTKINPAQGSVVLMRITDAAGNVTIADPVLTLLSLDEGVKLKQTFKRIPPQEHFITVTNGALGLKRLKVIVNGVKFKLPKLVNDEVRLLDVGSAMNQEKSTITLIGTGQVGASAFVIIGDSFLEESGALEGFRQERAQRPQDNFVWGETQDEE